MDLRGFPVFTGSNLESWTAWLEKYFVLHHFTDDDKLNLSQALLEGDAQEWCHRCESFQSWNEMKRELWFRFESPPRRVLSSQHMEEIQEILATLTTKIDRLVDSVVLQQAPQRHVADAEKIVEDDGASVMVKSEKYVPAPHNVMHRSLQVPSVPKVTTSKPPGVLLETVKNDVEPSLVSKMSEQFNAHNMFAEMPLRGNKNQKKFLIAKQRKRVKVCVWFKKIKVKIQGNAIGELPVEVLLAF